ncbi:MAG: hypothetical protein IJY58_04000 [Alphaproteobacteria bacterium]|nr:hypothetical protein [Alphaproteobacteria bacterium]
MNFDTVKLKIKQAWEKIKRTSKPIAALAVTGVTASCTGVVTSSAVTTSSYNYAYVQGYSKPVRVGETHRVDSYNLRDVGRFSRDMGSTANDISRAVERLNRVFR